jgi:protein-tyrosine phosphatase
MESATTVTAVLFVCTGNTCRSPMAAAIAERIFRERLGANAPKVLSAGVFAGSGAPATQEAVSAVERLGGSLVQHRSTPLERSLVQEAGVIYCMTMDHARAVLHAHPEAEGRVYILDPGGQDIPDPIGGPQELYDRTADRIEQMIRDRLPELLS